jgi:hypothetical protein
MKHQQIIEENMLLAQNYVDMTNYKRIKPDCFIEIYNAIPGNSFYTDYNDIIHLEKYLEYTKNKGLKTIGIFKIKFKNDKKL